jgi:hypothetical protein
MSKAAQAAAEAITGSQAGAIVSTPDGELPEDAKPVVFDRLGVERRILCGVSDELHSDRLGPRNTLAAIADWAISDPNTTNPPAPNGKLDIKDKSLAEQVQLVLDNLDKLIKAGLVERKGDVSDPAHTYHVTKAGTTELQS